MHVHAFRERYAHIYIYIYICVCVYIHLPHALVSRQFLLHELHFVEEPGRLAMRLPAQR